MNKNQNQSIRSPAETVWLSAVDARMMQHLKSVAAIAIDCSVYKKRVGRILAASVVVRIDDCWQTKS